jgi:hypothetical protein
LCQLMALMSQLCVTLSYRDRFCRSGAAVRDPSEHDNRIRNTRSADNRGSGDPRLRNLRFWITALVPRLATCPFPLVMLRDEIDGAGTLDFIPQSQLRSRHAGRILFGDLRPPITRDLGIGLHAVAKKRDRPIAVRERAVGGCEVLATLDLAVG